MTDKVQKIREKVVWLMSNHDGALDYEAALEDVRNFIDSMQEEHDEIVDKCLYGKEPELVDADDLPKEEPVSEELEEAMNRAAEETRLTKAKNGHPFFSEKDFNLGFSNGAQWQKSKLIKWLTSEADYLIQELQKGNKAYGLSEQYRAQLYKEIVNKLKDE